jgi:hypothetical protein
MLNAADLPNDINALKALLLARDEQILGLEAQLNTRAPHQGRQSRQRGTPAGTSLCGTMLLRMHCRRSRTII